METHKRTLAKTFTFRIIATIATMLFVYIVTGNLALMGIIGGFEVLSKLILYYLHERAWENIAWGRKRSK